MAERDALSARALPAIPTPIAASAPADASDPHETIRGLEARLARAQAHAEALEEKVAVLTQASTQLAATLEVEIKERRAAERECAAAQSLLEADGGEEIGSTTAVGLDGRTILYVGGRPRQVANLRRLAGRRGGRLVSHDGGIEDNLSLLPGLVGQADLVLFPVKFVSHEASAMVKRACECAGTPFRPLRSASLTSFVQAVLPEPR